MTHSLRRKFFRQAVESIAFIHSKGVIHSDLRPDNFLVHGTWPGSLDLWLCDFGGSACAELNLDGGQLPDSGFYDPNAPLEASEAIDIFGLGSVLYTIVTGHWPFRATTGHFDFYGNEREEYEAHVDSHFAKGIFPDVEGLFGGEIMLSCWTYKFSNAAEIIARADQLTMDL